MYRTRRTIPRADPNPRIRYGPSLPGGLVVVHLTVPLSQDELAVLRARAERKGQRVSDIAAACLADALRST